MCFCEISNIRFKWFMNSKHIFYLQKTEEIAKCAMRMGYRRGETDKQTAEHLLMDYRGHTQRVHNLYQKIVNAS